MRQPTYASAFGAADLAIGRRRQELTAWVVAAAEEQPPRPVEPSSTTTPNPVVSAATTPSSPWDCIALAETGRDWTMHGSTYSTAFGMVNDIIYEYGTPEEQAAVFSGTATPEQQIDIASRFAADHGFGGWGTLTKSKCGL